MNDSLRYLAIIFYFVAIGFLVFSLFILSSKYEKTGAKKFNLLNNFIFEINGFKRNSKKSVIYVILFIVSIIFFLLPYLFFTLYFQSTHFYTSLIILIEAILVGISLVFLYFVKLTNYKLHLFFDCLLVCSNLLLMGSEIVFIGTNVFVLDYVIEDSSRVLILIIACVLIICEFCLMLNPTYKTWDRLVKMDANTYNRPKVCYLSLLEWGSFLIFIIDYSIIILALFL